MPPGPPGPHPLAYGLVAGAGSGRLAFVLAGGGSLGAVQVGMLRALVEAGVQADLVVGASVGAVNGAHFAGRPDAAGIEALAMIWRRLRRRDVFPFSPLDGLRSLLPGRNHLVDPARLRRLIERHVAYRDFDEAALPFHVVATDVLIGTEVVVSSGSVVDAVMASAAIPGVFPPVRIDGRHLADGGIANNTPISVALDQGAETLVVLPTGFSCEIHEPPGSSMGMALHGLTLLIARQIVVDLERYADRAALRVVPPLCPLETSPVDFERAERLIEEATRSTRDWIREGGLEQGGIPEHLRPHPH